MTEYPASGAIKVVYLLGAVEKEFMIMSGTVSSIDKERIYDYIYSEVVGKLEIFRNIGALKRLLSILS